MKEYAAPETVVITGASSGLGAELAKLYAAPGVSLALIGRNVERLNVLRQACEVSGAAVSVGVLDVRDAASLTAWLSSFADRHPVDVAIAAAGMPFVGRG